MGHCPPCNLHAREERGWSEVQFPFTPPGYLSYKRNDFVSQILFEDEVDHLTICDKFLVPCPNGCKKKEIPRGEVSRVL